jgi:hypothetical protein
VGGFIANAFRDCLQETRPSKSQIPFTHRPVSAAAGKADATPLIEDTAFLIDAVDDLPARDALGVQE